ncbi:MAG: hypothetical protein K8H88_32720 [Sandaracinaceae bacterium]|nr:hypothetical protein [Sandaracinaceae bacterium]
MSGLPSALGISKDARLRLMAMLLVPGLVGHTIQLLGEDTPWRDHAYWRYFNTPGWHLYLSPWVPVTLAVALWIAVLGMAMARRRPWLVAVIGLYVAHYLTYPYRIRNHMSHTLFELVMLGGCVLIGALGGAAPLRGGGPRSRLVDRYAVTGMAAVLCVTYLWAGLHKINANFLALDDRSAAVVGLTAFWIHGDLGSSPPVIARWFATWGTVVVECLFPPLAWRFARLRVPLVIGLMIFHFPHVAVMDVADYPMLASVFYPALFSPGHFRILSRHLYRAQAWSIIGSAIGIAAQIWWIPWWGSLTGFGILVMALWGWAAGAMLRMLWHGRGHGRGHGRRQPSGTVSRKGIGAQPSRQGS